MKHKKSGRKAGILSGIIIGFIVALLFFSSIGNVVMDKPEFVEREIRYRRVFLDWLGEATPGSGASGVLEVYVNNTNTSASPYDSNITGALADGDVNNSHIESDVPYGTAFDVVLKVRWNKTHAYDTAWNLSLVRAYANCTVLGVTSIPMEETEINESTDYVYVHYFLRDNDGGAGSGFTIAEGVNVTGFAVVFESYYYA